MPEIKDVNDNPSVILPRIDELRSRQNKGAEQRGLDENYTGQLNETQYQDADIQK